MVMRYVRVKVDFSSPDKTLSLLKAVVFLLLWQIYGKLSHIILELLPLSLLLKNMLSFKFFIYVVYQCTVYFDL